LLTQGGLLAPLLGHGGFAVELVQAHRPGVGNGFGLGMQPDSGFFEQPEVVAAARVMGEAENPARGPVDDELCLQGVAFFLARVVPALFF
jgi:hypothetical protein